MSAIVLGIVRALLSVLGCWLLFVLSILGLYVLAGGNAEAQPRGAIFFGFALMAVTLTCCIWTIVAACVGWNSARIQSSLPIGKWGLRLAAIDDSFRDAAKSAFTATVQAVVLRLILAIPLVAVDVPEEPSLSMLLYALAAMYFPFAWFLFAFLRTWRKRRGLRGSLTVADKAEADTQIAELPDVRERDYHSLAERSETLLLYTDRLYRVRVLVSVGAIVGVVVFFLLRWASFSDQGNSTLYSGRASVVWAIAAALGALAVVDWFLRGREMNFKRTIEHQQSQREGGRQAVNGNRDGNIGHLRTSWAPNNPDGPDGYLDVASIAENMTAPTQVQEDSASPRISYQAYLKTPHWKRIRSEALQRAGNRCQLNASHTRNLQVHHNNYECLWHEGPEDVIVLCGDCHGRFHLERNMPDSDRPT